MATLTALPDSFTAGTTVQVLLTVPDYPASSGWTVKLMLAGANLLTVTASASGADHLLTIAAAASANLAAGAYRYAIQASKAGEVYDVSSGTVQIEPNLATALAGQHQSKNERLLELVEALLEGRVIKDVEAYGIDAMTVSKIPTEKLWDYRASLKAAIAREKRGGGFGIQHRVAFTGAENE